MPGGPERRRGVSAWAVTAVAVRCSAWLGVAVILALTVELSWGETRWWSCANLLKRLGCYWAFARLSVCLYLLRSGRKLLCKLLLCVAAFLELLDGGANFVRDFFQVHLGWFGGLERERLATPNDPKLSDSGPGTRMGAAQRKAKARAVPGFMAGRTARD